MLIGFIWPALSRLTSRSRLAVGVAVMVAGLAMVGAWAGLALGRSGVLVVRTGILVTLAGSVLMVVTALSALRGHRRDGA